MKLRLLPLLVALSLLPVAGFSQSAAQPLVTVRLFVDLDCPFSRQAWPIYRQALARAPDVKLVVQQLPLSVHPLAANAALAAIAARKLGRELEFVDALMAEPTPDAAAIQRAAATAGLDMAQFNAIRLDPATAPREVKEEQAGLAFGVRSTPSALVNGRGLSGVPRADVLERVIQAARRQAARERAEDGPQADLERIGLLRQAPEFLAAFDALVASRADAPAQMGVAGTLGPLWRVRVDAGDLAFGHESAVTIVQFLDPTIPWQLRDLAALLKLQAQEAQAGDDDVRVVIKLLVPDSRASGNGKVPPPIMQLAAQALLAPVQALKLLRSVTETPPAESVHAVTDAWCTENPAVLKAADAPATSAWLQLAAELARHTDAAPGAIFLNGHRWFGRATDAGLRPALAELRAACKALPGKPAPSYAGLVAQGRYLEDAELDLAPPEPADALPALPALGDSGVPVYLFGDFRSPHSRAAFYMLRRLVSSPDVPIRLSIAVIPHGAEPGATPSGSAILAATRLGKGMAFAESLFDADKPDEPASLHAAAKKSKLDVTLLQKAVVSAETQDALRAVWRARRHLDMRDEPVIYVGGRLYLGPLDESRLERAVRFARDARLSPSAGAACQP